MKSIWNKKNRDSLLQRLDRLTPESRAKWGKFTAPQLIAHLNEAMRMSLGELKTAPKNTPFKNAPMKQLVIYVLPWPKGAPTAPELLRGTTTDWAEDMRRLKEYIVRFATSSVASFPEHPAFGKVSRRGWGVLVYKHLDHHLKQFGL